MTRRVLAILAAFAILSFGGVTVATAEQGKPEAVKTQSDPDPAKSQSEAAKAEKAKAEDRSDAIGFGKGKTASDLARDAAAHPGL